NSLRVGDQGNEANGVTERNDGMAVLHADEVELLGLGRTDRDDQASTLAELGDQSGWDIRSGGGDEDGVEGGLGGKTESAVASKYVNIAIPERGDDGASVGCEGGMTLDGKNLCREFREESGDVAGAGTDLQDDIGGRELQILEHDSDDVGLGNGLLVTDGQRVVFIGFGAIGFGNEGFTGNAKHGVEHARVGDAAGAELGVDHALAGGEGIGHGQWLVNSGQWSVTSEKSDSIADHRPLTTEHFSHFLRRRTRTSKLTTPF